MSEIAIKKTVTVEEAARALGIGRNLAYLAVKSGEIPSIRIGKRILVPAAAVRRMLGDGTPPAAA
jgi:excisionase family DNA binding protein